VCSRNLENEEAEGRYRAVKIQPQWVVTPRKQQQTTLNPSALPNSVISTEHFQFF
jgi:hypothetical protein